MIEVTTSNCDQLSPVKRAILELRDLRARLDEYERRHSAPVAVIGIGCRFPGGADDPDSFWRLLRDGVDAITGIPADRWDADALHDPDPDTPGKMVTRYGGFLRDVDRFDDEFFGISPREAAGIDPQHRLLLEVAWRALEDAGQPPDRLFGSATGVFAGISGVDYSQLQAAQGHDDLLDAYFATGNAHSIASGRLSYVLGLHGPALSVDTGCSSSLVAVHLACQSLRTGECRLALAGGVNLILGPGGHIAMSRARMLSPDGRCKAFDATADGFARAEGCGMLVLKRLDHAIADGDRIRAVIRGSAVNQDGRSSGLTAPNGPSQSAVIRAALDNAGFGADRLQYIEAHGTGTPLGDPIEASAVASVVGDRAPEDRVRIGSVKTNFGHAEAAAGVAGLVKVILALEHREIPPHLHLREANPHVEWARLPLELPIRPMAWPAGTRPRAAGVSSFSFSGTNAHIILEEAPAPMADGPGVERPLHLLALSARTVVALRELASRYADALAASPAELPDFAYTANAGRSHFAHRATVVAATAEEAIARLRAVAAVGDDPQPLIDRAGPAEEPTVVFLVPGAGAPLAGMGRRLYETQPTFRAAIDRCAALLTDGPTGSLIPRMFPTEGVPSPHDAGDDGGLASFVLAYALGELWASWGIRPAAVVGQGPAELVASCLSGAMGLEEALRLSSRVPGWRGRPDGLVLEDQAVDDRADRVMVELGPTANGDECRIGSIPRGSIVRLPSLQPGRDDWETMLASLATLYRRGVPVDWKGFDRDYGRRIATLPGYPFERKRFWFLEASGPADDPTPDERWARAVAAAGRQQELVPINLALHTYGARHEALDRIATGYMIRTLRSVGAFVEPGASLAPRQLVDRHGIRPIYATLMRRWLDRLAAVGLLREQEGRFIADRPLPDADPEAAVAADRGLFADAPALLRYLEGCGRMLTGVITGKEAALETLFPGGSSELADELYRDGAMARYFNGIVRAVAESLAADATAARPLRILEVGAGTGGTTAAILPALPPGRVEYDFTDVSDFFLARAAERFRDFRSVRYGRLDLERDPEEQGYALHRYDVVVAANVIHATADLALTLDRVSSLLAPDGVFVLYEVTDPPSYADVTVALIEGWQRFDDGLREDSPLLDVARWHELLRSRGFGEVVAYPTAGSPAEVLGSHVVISRGPGGRVPGTGGPGASASAHFHGAPDEASRLDDEGGESLLRRLDETPESEHVEVLVDFVRRAVAGVLRREAAETIDRDSRLMDLGLDSLMAVELRNRLTRSLRLDRPLSATLIFDHPSIHEIAVLLARRLGKADPAAAGASALEDLSDAEVERLLLAKLSPSDEDRP